MLRSECSGPPRLARRALRALSLGAALLASAAALGSAPLPAAQAASTSGDIPLWAQGEVFGSVPLRPGDKSIALTFDDGPLPGASNTEGVLSALASVNVKATFFFMGSRVQAYPALARRVRDAGHAVGNHTWSHLASPEDPVGEVERTDAVIASTLGIDTALFRPPMGNMTNGVAGTALAQGDGLFLWSVDPFDWSSPGTQAIVDRVVSAVKPGGIILLHDASGDNSQTVAAVPIIVNTLRAQGYRFVTIPELLDARDAAFSASPTPAPPTPTPTPSPTTGDGLSATYYSNSNFTGTTASRVDPRVSFIWGWSTAPAPGIGTDTFSARWTGQVVAPTTGTYTFTLAADDGMRMWIDGRLVIDRWRSGPNERSASVALTGGRRTDIRIEYYENTGSAGIVLSWSRRGMSRQVVPQSALFSRAATTPTPTPAPPPAISIVSPRLFGAYPSLGSAGGTATNNGSGVPRVSGLLFRYSDSTYWNGTAWVASPTESAATVSSTPTTPGGSVYNWNYRFPTLADGQYAVQAVARNASGSATWLPWTLFHIDTTPPRVTLDGLENGGVYSSVTQASGIASDIGPGVASVHLLLRRLSDGAYWDGEEWSTTRVEVPTQTFACWIPDGSLGALWAIGLPRLSPGDYWMQAVARDTMGLSSPSNELRFTISSVALAAAPRPQWPARPWLAASRARRVASAPFSFLRN